MPKENGNNSSSNFLKSYTIWYIVAGFLILVALFWSIGLSGAQTGSSTTIGAGSIISVNPDGEPSVNYEIFVQATSIILTMIGVAIFVYYYTKERITKDLVNKGYTQAAMEIDGKNESERK